VIFDPEVNTDPAPEVGTAVSAHRTTSVDMLDTRVAIFITLHRDDMKGNEEQTGFPIIHSSWHFTSFMVKSEKSDAPAADLITRVDY